MVPSDSRTGVVTKKDMRTYDTYGIFDGHSHALRAASLLFILTGIGAIVAPFAAGISLSVFFGVLVVLDGFAYGALAFHVRGTAAFLFRLIVGLSFIAVGVYLCVQPGLGLLDLTPFLALTFFVEGVGEVAAFLSIKGDPRSVWLLLNALISILIALLIWRHWPSSASWAVGTIVGVKLVFSGITPSRLASASTR